MFGRCMILVLTGIWSQGGAFDVSAAEHGVAANHFHSGGETAKRERSSPEGLTAAHRPRPFGTMLRVTIRSTGHSVVVRIIDRGPFTRGRMDAFIQQWDADHDGTINRDELRKATGNRLDKLFDELFQAADKDHDGRLDNNELIGLTGQSFF